MSHIQYLSDPLSIDRNEISVPGETLVVSGDIVGIPNEEEFINWCSDNFRQTYILMGNKEYYTGVDVSDTLLSFTEPIRHNVRYVNNTSVKVGGSELFFTTFWRAPKDGDISEVLMGRNDFDKIICNGKLLSLELLRQLHEVCMQWLIGALVHSTSVSKIVFSHFPINVESLEYNMLKTLGADAIICGSEY